MYTLTQTEHGVAVLLAEPIAELLEPHRDLVEVHRLRPPVPLHDVHHLKLVEDHAHPWSLEGRVL